MTGMILNLALLAILGFCVLCTVGLICLGIWHSCKCVTNNHSVCLNHDILQTDCVDKTMDEGDHNLLLNQPSTSDKDDECLTEPCEDVLVEENMLRHSTNFEEDSNCSTSTQKGYDIDVDDDMDANDIDVNAELNYELPDKDDIDEAIVITKL